MSSSRFASRHRKDLSTDMIRTKIAHRKSLSQKENRYKEYERNRHFGLKDVNIPTLGGRVLVSIDESAQDLVPETNSKTRSMKTVQSDERRQMLQKYKEEKQLKKLKEQREKAKQGVFKVGLYRPDTPCFLLTNQNAPKAKEKKAIPSNVRITRSKAKDQMGQTKINNGSDAGPVRAGQRQSSEKIVLDKQKKVVQPTVSLPMRVTRSATQMTKQIAQTVTSATTRKPVTRAANDNEPDRKAPNKGRPARKIETKPDKVISFKANSEQNTKDSQISATNVMDPDRVLPEMENIPKTDEVLPEMQNLLKTSGVLPEVENLPKTYPSKTRGKNSFAPQDFVFQPLDGLKTYQVTPMTPRSASAFLTPSYSWNPLKPEGDKIQEAREYSKPIQQCPLSSLPVSEEEHGLSQNEATTKISNCFPIKEAPSLEINEGQISQPQHDVPYFRHTLQSETEKLTALCLEWDRKLELDIPDDAKDLIRTAVGQTRLLMKERFKQFEGLVNDCEYKQGEKETTCADLDGFWDMVTFQVEDVNKKFNNLTKLEESGWQNSNTNTRSKVIRKKIVSGVASKPKLDDGGRAAARSRLAAIKNAMRERIKQGEHADTVASVTPKEVDKIVFDAGFFRVESPVKSFSVLPSECCAQRLGTPKFVSKAVPANTTEMDLVRQKSSSPENLDSHRECVDKKTLFSNIPESRDTVEDAQCSEPQDVIEVSHGQDINEVNFEMYCVPSGRMSSPLLCGVTDGTTTNKEISDVVEEMELNPSVASQDVLMSSPEKNLSLQNTILKEAETSQSVLCDNKSLTTEFHFLDSPGLNCGNLGTQVEKRHQEHARHISFGGNLIAFSPLRPLSGE